MNIKNTKGNLNYIIFSSKKGINGYLWLNKTNNREFKT